MRCVSSDLGGTGERMDFLSLSTTPRGNRLAARLHASPFALTPNAAADVSVRDGLGFMLLPGSFKV